MEESCRLSGGLTVKMHNGVNGVCSIKPIWEHVLQVRLFSSFIFLSMVLHGINAAVTCLIRVNVSLAVGSFRDLKLVL